MEKIEVKAVGFFGDPKADCQDTKQMAQIPKGRLVKGQYKPI